MLQRPLRLGVLLAQRVIEDDLVPLDQTLTVLLPMLQLLISVPLDALKESRQGQLLRVAELRLLLFDDALHLGLKLGSLKLLEQVRLLLDALSLIVPLHSDQLGLSVAELEQILTELHLLLELGADLLLVVLELDHVLLFQLFQR